MIEHGNGAPVFVPVAVGFTQTDEDGRFVTYLRALPKERIKVVDCFSVSHNTHHRGDLPGLIPPIPDGHVDYSVWVHWSRGGAGWLRGLFRIAVGVLRPGEDVA